MQTSEVILTSPNASDDVPFPKIIDYLEFPPDFPNEKNYEMPDNWKRV